MSMRHHWAELDALLAELDEAERFKRGRPKLAAVTARNHDRETEALPAEEIPSAPAGKN